MNQNLSGCYGPDSLEKEREQLYQEKRSMKSVDLAQTQSRSSQNYMMMMMMILHQMLHGSFRVRARRMTRRSACNTTPNHVSKLSHRFWSFSPQCAVPSKPSESPPAPCLALQGYVRPPCMSRGHGSVHSHSEANHGQEASLQV
jgi:hypothetical protein